MEDFVHDADRLSWWQALSRNLRAHRDIAPGKRPSSYPEVCGQPRDRACTGRQSRLPQKALEQHGRAIQNFRLSMAQQSESARANESRSGASSILVRDKRRLWRILAVALLAQTQPDRPPPAPKRR